MKKNVIQFLLGVLLLLISMIWSSVYAIIYFGVPGYIKIIEDPVGSLVIPLVISLTGVWLVYRSIKSDNKK